MGGHNLITITGELTTNAYVDIPTIVRSIVGDKYGIQTNIVKQSPFISQGVDNGGAGDQGIMVGYACNENEDMIPQELYLARKLCKYLYKIWPQDGKTQITIDENNEITTVVASFCGVESKMIKYEIERWLRELPLAPAYKIYANPAGDWDMGGFDADTGVTGRKLAVDNYGPQIPIGGGAFSGKDSTKVDRSGAYMARKIAVEALKYYKAKEVIVKLAYSIGIAEPVMATMLIDNKLKNITDLNEVFDLTPAGIVDKLKLKEQKFQKTAEWGHFGNDFNWD